MTCHEFHNGISCVNPRVVLHKFEICCQIDNQPSMVWSIPPTYYYYFLTHQYKTISGIERRDYIISYIFCKNRITSSRLKKTQGPSSIIIPKIPLDELCVSSNIFIYIFSQVSTAVLWGLIASLHAMMHGSTYTSYLPPDILFAITS